ncbi:carboxypeptidase-like regulatory domain-containing protein [Flavobacterium caeni]|uniref:TonB-dependent Receptor Plug Domain n=1 Tax=Flavobacterium caeni TaxID=490189 RepID=A0A1G5EAT7_9FLAO|nr:carboxypeptidase-like regulatory domain-containing protein [Flavobacterium caeni]SCY23800.1 TonB-dependent Receptor Plug Domain [Flavobacterium caeni]
MKVYLFILTLLFCGVVHAQTTVTGSVTDNTGQPVPGANVKVVGDSAGTVTDDTGKFTLNTSATPPFSIEISSVGYGTKTAQVQSNNQMVSVSLTDQENKLDEIVVSASRTPERVLESPVTIERMSQQAIKATTAASYYDGLENLKEVHFNTSSLSFKSINTRGFSTVANTRFMQLVDGMDNSSPALNFVLGNLIGISELDVANVELLPGASSALYGANAFNGILFMNSKSPFLSEGISTYVKYGQTTQDVAGTNDYWDVGIRAAKKFTRHFAAKANFTFLKATEWIAADTRNVENSNIIDNPDAIGHAANLDYDGLNIYGDEAKTNLKGVGQTLAAMGLLPNPDLVNLLPSVDVSRTGYAEKDMSDNKIQNLKADFSLHFKPWDNDFEIILQSKIGTGNTIYQGANRYYLKNFYMNQNKIELKKDNFFVRFYMTDEDAGDSYDMRFAGLAVNNMWKSNNTWFGEYAGAYIQSTLAGQTPAVSHMIARSVADTGRFLPGSPEFKQALAAASDDPNLQTGSKFIDQSQLWHGDANYNFKNEIKFAEIQVGGSWRQYIMDSQGTIFTDFDGPLKYEEYGAYAQLVKKFMAEERLKLTASVRYDKSQNFDGFFSPRVALGYAAGSNKQHNFRLSYQTGFRNPTTQDQYIGLDLGPTVYALIGSAPDNLSRYTEVRQVSQAGIDAGQPTEVTLDGNLAYNNSYSVQSVREFRNSGDASVLRKANFDLVKPERVQAFEVGYRSVINNDLSVDISGYYNIYNDFLNQVRVLTPLYGTVGTQTGAEAVSRGDLRTFQIYTNTGATVTSFGIGIGLSKKIYRNFELGVNYNHAQFEFDETEDPDFIPGFNTPEHRFKAMLGNDSVVKTAKFQLGFNTNVRWSDEYLWQSTFAEGMIPEVTVFDAQITMGFPTLKSVLKVGGNNLFGEDYLQVVGAGRIGQQWFVGLTINP